MSTKPRSLFPRLIATTLVIFTIGLSMSGHAEENRTIEINGGFEQTEEGTSEKWEGISFRFTDEVFQSGAQSLALAFPLDPKQTSQRVIRHVESNKFRPNERIEFSVSAFLKTDLAGGESVGIGMDILDPQGVRKVATGFTMKLVSGQWETVSKTLTIPEGFDDSWRVAIMLVAWRKEASSEEKEVFFDDISITAISQQ